jgi:hypothetical protein
VCGDGQTPFNAWSRNICKAGLHLDTCDQNLYWHKSRNSYESMRYLSCVYIYMHVEIQISKLALFIVSFAFDFFFLCN